MNRNQTNVVARETSPIRIPVGVLVVLCVITVGVGLLQAWRVLESEDTRARNILLLQTATIAQSVLPNRAQSLLFTEQDLTGPYFKRLSREFHAVAENLGLSGIYTVAHRAGTYRFGPESFLPGDPLASVPGTIYQRPPPKLIEAFETGRPRVAPYYTDEFGTVISAYVPVVQPLTGEVLLVVGADLYLPRWRGARAKAAATVLGFTGALLLLLVAGGIFLRRRPSITAASYWWQRHAEAVWCATILLVLTAAIALRLHYSEGVLRNASFRALAQQQTLSMASEFWGIRSSLHGLAQSFQFSHHVPRRDFATYSSRFLDNYAIQAAFWLPAVPAANVAAFEAEAAAEGLEDYHVWQHDPLTNRVPATGRSTLFPILYIEPYTPHVQAVGHDHGSEPLRGEALRMALASGLTCASDPVSLFGVTNQPLGFVVYLTTLSQTQTGLVAFAINMNTMLHVPMNRSIALPDEFMTADLFQLVPERAPRLLVSNSPEQARGSTANPWHLDAGAIGMKLPIFAFGKAYVVIMRASPGWLAANPLQRGLHAVLAGLVLTVALTFLVGFLSANRARLEREVSARTAELRIAHDKLSGILNASPVAMMLLDRDARVLDANPSSERLIRSGVLAYRNEPCGVFLHCIRHEGHGCGKGIACQTCVLRNTVREVAESGTPVFDRNVEILAEPNGEMGVFHLKFGAAPVKIDGVTHVVVALYDISTWHRTEQLYSKLFNEMRYGLMLLRPAHAAPGAPIDFVVTAANPVIHTLIGVDPKAITGQALRRVRSDVPESFFAILARSLEGGGASPFNVYLSGLARFFEGTVFRPLEGQIAVIFTDVTDRMRAEDQARAAAAETTRLLEVTEEARRALLAANEEQKKADEALIYERNLLYVLMDSQPDRIFFSDAEGRFIKVSKVEAQALGLASPEEAIGKTLADLRPGEASQRIMATNREIMRSGRPLLAHVEESVGADGSLRWDSVSKAPIRDREGHVVGIVGITRDITPQIEMQQQLQQVSKMDAIGRLAGGVAHDFNNLLQAILGFTELLLLGRTEQDSAYGDLKQIERAAGRAIGLTRQLLMFGRKQRIEPRVIEINQVIGNCEKMLRRLTGAGITLRLALAQDTGCILADASQIEQILMNLTVNAKDAMSEGGTLEIRTELVSLTDADTASIPEAQAGDFLCLTVSDTGCGIAPEVMNHLFEPFYTTKEQDKGTGLGLSVIYGIVKQSHGWINVYTALNQGTTFKIFFPAVRAAGAGTQPEQQPAARPDYFFGGDGKMVLLVEDEPGVRFVAERALQTAGYSVQACANAAEALAYFEREGEHVDLLFSDIVMAGHNGVELALELRRRHPGLPVLLSSGYADNTVQWAAIMKEGFSFLPKPYPTQKLLQAVRQTMESAAAPQKV